MNQAILILPDWNGLTTTEALLLIVPTVVAAVGIGNSTFGSYNTSPCQAKIFRPVVSVVKMSTSMSVPA